MLLAGACAVGAGPAPASSGVVEGQIVDLRTPGPPIPNEALGATVVEVIDGDTIIVDIDGSQVTVRLLGIDTPEKPGGPRPAECFGHEASAFANEVLPRGAAIHLSRDHATRDQFGRLLAFVHRSDGLFVNLALVELGYATPLFFSPNTAMRDTFGRAADLARRDWQGFWASCGAADVVLTE